MKGYSAVESMVDRLTAIKWEDYEVGDTNSASRVLLMREFLRRSALWVQYAGGAAAWPIVDIAALIDPEIRAPEEIVAQMDAFASECIPEFRARDACRLILHWVALRECPKLQLPDLADPFEPLIVLYERGGVFFIENGVADFELRRVPLGNWKKHLATDPIVQLDPVVLDAVDAKS